MLTLICILLLSWTSNALAEKLKEKKSRIKKRASPRGGVGGEGKKGDGGGEGKTWPRAQLVPPPSAQTKKGDGGVNGGGNSGSNRNRANSAGSAGSLGSLDSMDENHEDVRPVGDNMDNIDWVPDYDNKGETEKAAHEHCSKGDYLASFKVHIWVPMSSSCVSCVLQRMMILRGIRFRVDWWPGWSLLRELAASC